MFDPEGYASPAAVGEEIARVVALPRGSRPTRTEVDFSNAGEEVVNAAVEETVTNHTTCLGFGEMLGVADRSPPAGSDVCRMCVPFAQVSAIREGRQRHGRSADSA